MDKDLEIVIDDQPVDLTAVMDMSLSISYKLEDAQDFTRKQGSSALSIKFPSTKLNDKIANTYYNPGIEDLTSGQAFRSIKKAKIKVKGDELLVGKAFLKSATHTRTPTGYEYDFYGNNSDWLIDLKDSTLYDFLKHLTFIFTKDLIIGSWQYDGTSEALPYVFAPIRYGISMEKAPSLLDPTLLIEDYNMRPDYMKPSLSKYWLIYWGLKSLGYKIKSDFMNLPYFRRQVMPWVWGSFLDSDGTQLDVLRFMAKSTDAATVLNYDFTGFIDVKATNDSINGAFDNSNVYNYVSNLDMTWNYPSMPAFNFGLLEATFHLNMFVNAVATANSNVEMRVQWFKNGVRVIANNDNGNGTELINLAAPSVGRREYIGPVDAYLTVNINPGDVVSAKIYVHTFKSSAGIARLTTTVDAFETAYFKTPIGGTINFANFLALKKWKFLDFLAGVVDEFDLVIQTDSSSKIVYIEPAHPYSLTDDMSAVAGGYFNGKYLDWSDLQDLSKESSVEPFTDSERELLFEYRDDSSDGTLKRVQDRNTLRLGLAKYVFPDRFAAGQREIENRFFATTMHYEVKQWIFGLDEPPQMIILAPENVSNLSSGEAQNTFIPKSVYYKGLTSKYKWVFDNSIGHQYPEMFAVNYKSGGELDPVLSYCDEVIGTKTGKGLLRRFFLQRLVIMRDGQMYTTWFKLNNNDATNFLHREHVICKGQKWELIQLSYNPLRDESTKCLMRKYVPIYP